MKKNARSGIAIGLSATLLLWLVNTPVAAATTTPPATQANPDDRDATCQATAKRKGMQGSAHAAFIKTCLSAPTSKPQNSPQTAQQTKMRTCNATAKTRELKGAPRKQFMKDCLRSRK